MKSERITIVINANGIEHKFEIEKWGTINKSSFETAISFLENEMEGFE